MATYFLRLFQIACLHPVEMGLKDVVDFFTTGDSEDPEVPGTVNETEGIGELGLTNAEVWQIVAFLKALTDQK